MDVFISWSGEKSKAVAAVLHKYLPEIIQQVKPWMSAYDIGTGNQWANELSNVLSKTRFGILCITKESASKPWLLFEAGALSRGVYSPGLVAPYFIDMPPGELDFPLAQFQGREATAAGTLELLKGVNSACDVPLSSEALKRSFERVWNDMEPALMAAASSSEASTSATPKNVELLQIVESIRAIERQLTQNTQAARYAVNPESSHEVLRELRGVQRILTTRRIAIDETRAEAQRLLEPIGGLLEDAKETGAISSEDARRYISVAIRRLVSETRGLELARESVARLIQAIEPK